MARANEPMFCPMTGAAKCHCRHERDMPQMEPHGVMLGADLKAVNRYLWSDHAVFLNWLNISSFPQDQPDNAVVTARLLENPESLARLYSAFANVMWVDRFRAAMREHLTLGKAGIAAVRGGNAREIEEAKAKILANGEEVAKILHEFRPEKLPLAVIRTMFQQHNEQEIMLATLRSQARYAEYVTEYDAFYKHMMQFADVLYEGFTY